MPIIIHFWKQNLPTSIHLNLHTSHTYFTRDKLRETSRDQQRPLTEYLLLAISMRILLALEYSYYWLLTFVIAYIKKQPLFYTCTLSPSLYTPQAHPHPHFTHLRLTLNIHTSITLTFTCTLTLTLHTPLLHTTSDPHSAHLNHAPCREPSQG